MENTFDVAIIGGGPSGCACALALHGSGLKVVLIEKESFPRDKICGDAIPGPSFKVMDKINAEWGQLMRAFTNKANVKTSKIFAPNGKSLAIDWVTYAYNSKRLNFDDFLSHLVMTQTQTKVIENKRLLHINIKNDGVLCQFQDNTSIKAAVIIGCDGANSVVTRQLAKFDFKDGHTCAAVRAYYNGVQGMQEGVNEFHFFKDLLPGYFWIFPLQNGEANVGFGILPSTNNTINKTINLRETLNSIIVSRSSIANRFKGAELLDGIKGFALRLGTEKRCISGERFMLCGDAAALIDPLQGHGIDKAMWSGYLAAQQLILCFKNNNFSADFMTQYDNSVYKKVGMELKRSTILMKVLSRFPVFINFLTIIGQNQKLVTWLARVLKI